tara:strand:- start:328 stop:915 length:588 start_codon:yes stop_codon:yes gene_type:complete
MIPWLREIKQPGRVQHLGFVGSSSHYFPDILTFPKQGVLQHFNQQEHWASGLHNYAISKLLFHYGALQLAKLAVDDDGKYEFLSHAHSNLTVSRHISTADISSPSPIVNIVCPGMIRTNIARGFANKGTFFKLIEALFMYIRCNPADVGARSLVLMGTTTKEEHGTFRNPMLSREEYDLSVEPFFRSCFLPLLLS